MSDTATSVEINIHSRVSVEWATLTLGNIHDKDGTDKTNDFSVVGQLLTKYRTNNNNTHKIRMFQCTKTSDQSELAIGGCISFADMAMKQTKTLQSPGINYNKSLMHEMCSPCTGKCREVSKTYGSQRALLTQRNRLYILPLNIPKTKEKQEGKTSTIYFIELESLQ